MTSGFCTDVLTCNTHILVHIPHKHVHTAYTCEVGCTFTCVYEVKSQVYLQEIRTGFSFEIEIKISGAEENGKVLPFIYLFILVTGCGFSFDLFCINRK